MTEMMNLVLALALILIAAKGSGYLSTRLGQPSVLGELLAGLILGPTLLNIHASIPWFVDDTHLSSTLTTFAEIGVLLLMFLAGLELELSDLLRSSQVASIAGTMGVLVPLLGGYLTSLLFGFSHVEGVFIGLALSATSVSISAQTLMELGVLRSKVGLALLGAAVFDDVLVVILLSASTILFAGETVAGGIGMVVLRILIYIVLASAVGIFLLPRLLRIVSNLPISQGITAFALVTCLLFAWASEAFGGMAAITGAFMAGLFLARTSSARRIEEAVSAMAFGFFVPIFLVNIGLQANLRAIGSDLWIFTLVLTAVAIFSKVIGSGGGALIAGFGRTDALRLGVGMISRGEVGLIVASVALSQSLIQRDSYSAVIFMIIVATIATPFLLRYVYRDEDADSPQTKPEKQPIAQSN